MAKQKPGTGAWSADPREALIADPDFDLNQMHRGGTPGWEDDKHAAKKFGDERSDLLSELQERLFAEGRAGGTRALLVIVQGLDTAGKGGVARHVMSKVDPQGVALRSFGPPTEAEQDSPERYAWARMSSSREPRRSAPMERPLAKEISALRPDVVWRCLPQPSSPSVRVSRTWSEPASC